jgi:hypothetical protein
MIGEGDVPSLHCKMSLIATGPHYIALGLTVWKTLLPTVPLLLHVYPLPSNCSGIVVCLHSHCLAMEVSTEPFPINGHLCWFKKSGFQQTCYNMYDSF